MSLPGPGYHLRPKHVPKMATWVEGLASWGASSGHPVICGKGHPALPCTALLSALAAAPDTGTVDCHVAAIVQQDTDVLPCWMTHVPVHVLPGDDWLGNPDASLTAFTVCNDHTHMPQPARPHSLSVAA